MVRVIVKGPQGSGKSVIREIIEKALIGQRFPHRDRPLKIYRHFHGDGICIVPSDTDVLIIEKQTKK